MQLGAGKARQDKTSQKAQDRTGQDTRGALPDGAIAENSARVALPERQGGRGSSTAQVDEGEVVPQLVRVVPHGRDVPEAQLSRPVVPPALD